MQPRIQYVRSADGTNIAYSAMGEGQPLIFSPNTWSHLEVQLSGEFGEAFQRVAQEGLLVVAYDMRGMGMSDRDVDDFSLDSQLGDIEALRERLGLNRFALYGNVFASLASIAYAAARRERVSHLILNLPFANGEDWYQAMPTLHGLETFRIMAKHHWEAYTLTHATTLLGLLPGADPRSLAALMRECTTPDTFSRYLTEVRTQDVRSLLAKVSAPSLILSPTSGGHVIDEAGRFAREVAAGIPDARLVAHEASFGRPGLPTTRLAAEFVLGRMIEWSAPPTVARTQPGPLRTVLFTDLVGHTEMMSRLGDERGRAVLREHERITREVLKANGGTEVKTMGDGFMASFGSVTKAVECAIALQRAFAEREGEPLSVRVGLNAGEPIEEDGDLFGATVILASRIAAKAEGGEILVADTVRGLCSGKGFLFAERGEFVAKGFEEPVRISEVRWRE